MKLKFIIDAQLLPALALRIREKNYEANHVFELGLIDATDKQIADAALKDKAVLITKDEDFIIWSNLGHIETQIIWIRLGNTTNKYLWSKIEPLFDETTKLLKTGEKIVEII